MFISVYRNPPRLPIGYPLKAWKFHLQICFLDYPPPKKKKTCPVGRKFHFPTIKKSSNHQFSGDVLGWSSRWSFVFKIHSLEKESRSCSLASAVLQDSRQWRDHPSVRIFHQCSFGPAHPPPQKKNQHHHLQANDLISSALPKQAKTT